jgi:uracil-DNA glycosylase
MSGIKNQVGDWYPLLEPIVTSDYFKKVITQVQKCKAEGKKVYPDTKSTFRAFNLCQLQDLKVVILGQDPYHDGRATGLAFANDNEITMRPSPSLQWIVKSIEHDYDTICVDFDWSLESWAQQGVLLLNTALTVEKGKAGSHTALWNDFTKKFIHELSTKKDNIIFVLWGKNAQAYEQYIKGHNKIFKAPHPAADAYTGGKAGFYTSGSFRSVNEFLDVPIKWNSYCGEPLPRERNTAPF